MKHTARFALLGALLCAFPALSLSAQWPQQPHLAVTGMAERWVQPDEMATTVIVETTRKDLGLALNTNQKIVEALVEEVSGLGLKKEDIQVSSVQMNKDYEYNRQSGGRTLVGYQARSTVQIILRDLSQRAALLRALTLNEDIAVQSNSLRVSKEREIREELQLEALAHAKTKATAMAEAMEVGLGSIPLQIAEQGGGSRPEPVLMMRAMAESADSGGSDVASEALGQIRLSAQVSVTFALQGVAD